MWVSQTFNPCNLSFTFLLVPKIWRKMLGYYFSKHSADSQGPQALYQPLPWLLRSASSLWVAMLVSEIIFLLGDSTTFPELSSFQGSYKIVELCLFGLSIVSNFPRVVDPEESGRGSINKYTGVMGTDLDALGPTGVYGLLDTRLEPCQVLPRSMSSHLALAKEPRWAQSCLQLETKQLVSLTCLRGSPGHFSPAMGWKSISSPLPQLPFSPPSFPIFHANTSFVLCIFNKY